MKLHAPGEGYLEAVSVLQKEKDTVRSVDMARHMEVFEPNVCHAVTTLKKGGFLTMDEGFSLHLTDIGREVTEQTYEEHCFFAHQLVATGVDPQTAGREAYRVEHTISQKSFELLKGAVEPERPVSSQKKRRTPHGEITDFIRHQ